MSAPELALEFRLVHRREAADVAPAALRVELVVGGAVGTGVGVLAAPTKEPFNILIVFLFFFFRFNYIKSIK